MTFQRIRHYAKPFFHCSWRVTKNLFTLAKWFRDFLAQDRRNLSPSPPPRYILLHSSLKMLSFHIDFYSVGNDSASFFLKKKSLNVSDLSWKHSPLPQISNLSSNACNMDGFIFALALLTDAFEKLHALLPLDLLLCKLSSTKTGPSVNYWQVTSLPAVSIHIPAHLQNEEGRREQNDKSFEGLSPISMSRTGGRWWVAEEKCRKLNRHDISDQV